MITCALQHDPANALSSLQWNTFHHITSLITHSLWSNRARCRHWFCQADPPSAWMGFAGLTFKIEASHFWHNKLHFLFWVNLGQAALETVTGGVWILRNWATKKRLLEEKEYVGESFLSESYQILPNLVSVGSSDRLEPAISRLTPRFFWRQVVTPQGCSTISWGGRTFMIT